uniref:FecR family protein n=1 Tax=Roseivirga sp. TaxID=1964215 RepID=UPI0040477D3F
MKKDAFIEDWLKIETSTSEQEELERLIAFTETLGVPEKKSKEQAWDELLGQIEAQTKDNQRILVPEKPARSYWPLWVAGYAAVFIALCVLLFNQTRTENISTFMAENGKIEILTLPDASVITMNSSSEIRYNSDEWPKKRNLQLFGEAFFEVTKGKDFTVETANGSISVLGTSFNVYAREGQLRVTCKTGKVRVNSNNEELILTAGQMATLVNNELQFSEYPVNKIGTWREGDFYFDAASLTDVIKELERQFDIQLNVTGNIEDRFYSGFFNKNNLQEALQLVFVPMGLHFEIKNGEVIVE